MNPLATSSDIPTPHRRDEHDSQLANRFILVIDDDADLLSLMREALEEAGATVVSAPDGLAGLRAVAAEPPDVVVTDILMPTKEGIATIIEMKRLYPDVKIIAISGGGRLGPVDFLDLAKRLGADAALSKPFPLVRLVEQCALLLT